MTSATTRRNFVRAGVALGAMLPLARPGVALAETVDPAMDTILRTVHPQLRAMASTILDNPMPPPTGENLQKARTTPLVPFDKPVKVEVAKRTIPGGEGQPEVTIYIVNPRPAGSRRPVLLHTHGGGYIVGSAQFAAFDVQDICLALDCPAVSVEYRLAPETTYQGSIEDNYAGLKWLHEHADEIGADPDRIALYGGSAGGGHAALLALTARDRGEIPVAFQCLIYPMLDDRTGSVRAVPPHMGALIWGPKENRFGWGAFLGMEAGGPDVPAAAVPARVADLSGLPPAFIGVGSIDLFLDEDVDYAQRLIGAEVPCELLVVPGAFHGFEAIVADAPISRAFIADQIAALHGALGSAHWL